MSWKEKLFTLINTRFYTKEEIDSKATVVFIGYDHDHYSLRYNGKDFTSNSIRIGIDGSANTVDSNILVMELPFGNYSFEATSEYHANMFQDEGGQLEVNQKLIFADAFELIGEPQVTTQQEI